MLTKKKTLSEAFLSGRRITTYTLVDLMLKVIAYQDEVGTICKRLLDI